jgi:hypothetical protein
VNTRTPKVDRLRVAGKKLKAELAEVVTEVGVEYATDALSELKVTAADPGLRLVKTPLATFNTEVTLDDEKWTVGSVEAAYSGDELTTVAVAARSPLARSLRRRYKVTDSKKVSPSQWVTARVKAAGGVAVCQQSSKQLDISQRGGDQRQSELDVIGNLASELDWSWTEHSNTFYFGSRHWAWKGGAKTPMWKVTWRQAPATDAITAAWTVSDDNSDDFANLDLELPYDAGQRMRPWHLIQVKGLGVADGVWLVDSVSVTHDGVAAVQVSASQPRKPSPTGGSSGDA